MNQEQRKFLIEKIEKTFKTKREALESKLPEEPNLNRHLISAVLTGTVIIKGREEIKTRLEKFVKALGNEDLIDTKDSYSYSRRRRQSDTEYYLKADPEIFIDMPESYVEAVREYEGKKAFFDKEIEALESQRDTLILKIQIGSSAILDKLITQVDSLGDLDLFSSQLSLIAQGIDAPGQKKIENKK